MPLFDPMSRRWTVIPAATGTRWRRDAVGCVRLEPPTDDVHIRRMFSGHARSVRRPLAAYERMNICPRIRVTGDAERDTRGEILELAIAKEPVVGASTIIG